MSDIEKAAAEALAIAKGESPAARIYRNGHFYVPQAEVERLRAALRFYASWPQGPAGNIAPLLLDAGRIARAALGEKH